MVKPPPHSPPPHVLALVLFQVLAVERGGSCALSSHLLVERLCEGMCAGEEGSAEGMCVGEDGVEGR